MVIIGVSGIASLFALTRWLAARLTGPPSGTGASLGGGRGVGPPSGEGAAWMIGASAKATTNSMAVNWVFRFFINSFSFIVLAFRDLSSLRTHFRPFTEVMRKSRREVTRNVGFAALRSLTR